MQQVAAQQFLKKALFKVKILYNYGLRIGENCTARKLFPLYNKNLLEGLKHIREH
jgi:hypothetical protein